MRLSGLFSGGSLFNVPAINVAGTGYQVGDTVGIPGGTGVLTITSASPVTPGTVTLFTRTADGTGYTLGDVLTGTIPGGTGWSVTVTGIASSVTGTVTSATIANAGEGYTVGDVLTATLPGGSGFSVTVTDVTPAALPNAWGEEKWSQAPVRFSQQQVADFVPPTANQQAIQYSFIYPVGDNPAQPPIGSLS
jgi:hypothetical protein